MNLGSFTDMDLGKDKFDELIKNSIPTKEKFIRISSVVSLPSIFYNFKLQTKQKTAYFQICSALGNTDDLWFFLELVASEKYNILYYESAQEGPNSTLRVEKIDDKNIRFTLVSNRWLEHKWHNNKSTDMLTWNNFPDYNYGVNLDIIIDKQEFIYAFYIEMRDIFNGSFSVDTIPCSTSNAIACKDSDVIKKYLGYVKAKKIDKELNNSIKYKSFEEIEQLLQKGANPNAIINDDEKTIFEVFLQDYCEELYDEEFKKVKENISNEESDKVEEVLVPFRDELEKKFFELVKLFIKYGAKTTCFYNAIYNFNRNEEVITYLLDHNCVFDMDTIGFVSTDSQICDTEDKFYEKLENLFDKYLFSCSHHYDDENDVIFRDPPDFYTWKGKRFNTQKEWMLYNNKY